ncbi:MAG: DOPA 4,5-dioxygenase family protein [Rhodospirillales bacterium]
MPSEEASVRGFHAHVYFSQETQAQAQRLCEQARDRFGLDMGRMHAKPVGPHPVWSCRLAFGPEKSGAVLTWLALNREGLTVFVHPETGDDLADHSRHAIWMGQMLPLKLEIFEEKAGA